MGNWRAGCPVSRRCNRPSGSSTALSWSGNVLRFLREVGFKDPVVVRFPENPFTGRPGLPMIIATKAARPQ